MQLLVLVSINNLMLTDDKVHKLIGNVPEIKRYGPDLEYCFPVLGLLIRNNF